MKVTAKIKCPGCQFGTDMSFSRPTSTRAKCFSFKCTACGSHVSAQVKRGKNQICLMYSSQLVAMSKFLVDMKKEEEEFNKPSSEEQLAEEAVGEVQ